MADTEDWDINLATLTNTINNLDSIQRKAMKAAANAVAPRLVEATPLRVSPKQGGNSLKEGELKESVRTHVEKDKETGKLCAVVDFGKHTWIAHLVDVGHNAPYSKVGIQLGQQIDSAKSTPAYPFIREVQDSERTTAQEAYEAAMTEGMNESLQGKH